MKKISLLLFILFLLPVLSFAARVDVGGGGGGGSGSVSDTVYGAAWDGVTTIAPSKNAVYDKIETLGAGSGDPILVDGTGVTDASGVDIQGGAGVAITFNAAVSPDTAIIATSSTEAAFLASGALTCGAGTAGKMQIHTTPLQYCDNAATPALQYAAYGSSAGVATSTTSDSTWTSHNSYPAACAASSWMTTIGDTVTCSQPAFTDISGAATDAQVPNTITVDLATTATTATTGDSATAFFASGTLEEGLLPDSATVTGWVMGASTATTPAIDDNDTSLATTAYVKLQIDDDLDASAELIALVDDETGTGALVFGTSPRITTSLLDSGGNELFKLTATGTAVNEFTIANAATGGTPTISATADTDANVGIGLTAKGTGGVVVTSTNAGPSTITHGLTVNNDGLSSAATDDFIVKGETSDTLFVVDASEDDIELGGLVETTGTAPTIVSAACGTTPEGSLSATATDMGGKITVGGGVITTCTMTFNQTWTIAPSCVVLNGTALSIFGTSTATTLVLTSVTSMDADIIMYNCFGQE